jgi:hypothetical protein
MVKRFLEYSLAHCCKIKVIYMETGKVFTRSILVKQINEADVVCFAAGKKKPLIIPVAGILSACYARGDNGDTLCNSQKDEINDR